jgi:hypothetical protein
MQNLKIKAELAGKTITKDLGWTRLTLKIDNIKPAQYGRLFQMGLTEIFENGEDKTNTSNEENGGENRTNEPVERTQSVAKKPRKKRSNS